MDDEARRLAERHYDDAVAIARHLRRLVGGDESEARSVAHLALCEAATTWVSTHRVGGFGAFLHTVIRRRLIDAFRSTYGRTGGNAKRARFRERPLVVITDEGDELDAPAVTYEETAYAMIELVDAVDRSGLTPRQRESLMARASGRGGLEELARQRGSTIAAASYSCRAARRKVKANLPV